MPRSKSGSVYERRPGVWECRVTIGGTTLRSVVHGSDQDAWADVRRMESEVGAVPSLGRDATLSDVWAAYRAAHGTRLAPKTMHGYDWLMGSFVLPALGDRLAWSITRSDVQRMMLGSGWSRDRAVRCRRVLSSVLTWAATEGYVSGNPIRTGAMELPSDAGALDALDDADDPFAAIEGTRDVWGVQTVLAAIPLVRGLPLEPCWLACVGAGLRVEEALALRRVDVRRIDVSGRMVTQLAVHHATPDMGGRKATKTARSVRVVSVAEPFGARLWEIASELPDRADLLCNVSAANQNKRWRGYFSEPASGPTAKHRPKGEDFAYTGRLRSLPYLPMSRMRATHATLMQEAGVPADLNAAYHGHSEDVAYRHYKRPDTTGAASAVGSLFELVG